MVVDQVDVVGVELVYLYCYVDGGVVGVDDDVMVGDGQVEQVVVLLQFVDVVGGGEQVGGVFVFQVEVFVGGQVDVEEYCVVFVVQGVECQVVVEMLVVVQFDIVDLQEEFYFVLGEVVYQFVVGDVVFVEVVGFGVGFEEYYVVVVYGQVVGVGQFGWFGVDYGDVFVGGW